MKIKTLATWSPLLLCLVAGAARAALEPFSFDVSETLEHQSNIQHADSGARTADWLSTTEFRAALDQAVGRDALKGSASVNIDRYGHKDHARNSEGYTAAGEFDWSTIGDLSGALGADSRRRQYLYGVDGDLASSARNLQTDNHAFARVQLGGLARWSIFTGFDVSERKYSDPNFVANEVRQWAVSGGSNYATSPDLSFGVQGRYVRGKYPGVVLGGAEEGFSLKTAGVNTRWKASGNSLFDANLGITRERTDGQPNQHYVSGGVNWHWTPPSHFAVTLGGSRDSSTNAGQGPTIANTNGSVTGRSLNTVGNLDVSYALTAKITLDAIAQYIHRKYTDALLPTNLSFGGVVVLQPATGSSNTSRFTLAAHYQPSRTTALGCSVARELHTSDQSINVISRPYTDNTVACTASIHFE